ncbi:hypothetical protein A5893_12955 [Pedobacter psychrophilus]|uniref:3-keto-disaccharide hydrolase domain-containing protein n=1 Tax=Pedobacter psychrophilus TaxID=1826909 RepID=A0A179DD25_9SPHI|nr:DUF1961 family protein [Pedobacter psychrophilus]OAQ38941.1 hypothetical protein A5893_12955 [Pedobacter psychrophilus]
MKLYTKIFILIFLTLSLNAWAQKPIKSYLDKLPNLTDEKVNGNARVLKADGRVGIQTTGVTSSIEIPMHNLNSEKGSVTVWVYSLEDLFPAISNGSMDKSDKNHRSTPFFSDSSTPNNYNGSTFFFGWYNHWHGGVVAKYFKGFQYSNPGAYSDSTSIKLYAWTNEFTIKANQWYQFVLTWDNKTLSHYIYANGILVGREDQYKKAPYEKQKVAEKLFAGSPRMCISNIDFYDEILTAEQVKEKFKNEVTAFNKETDEELRHVHTGEKVKNFNWAPGKDWTKKMDLSLKNPTDIDSFYVQGYGKESRITPEGLIIETPKLPGFGKNSEYQVYFWSMKPFEGELYVEYEFKPLIRGGLSLLMLQSSGMSREDFMGEYPWRTTGTMSMVYGEDVRNYHWEYYREVDDIRNDIYNGGLIKNPYGRALAYGTFPPDFEVEKWHKLQFRQIGGKLVGAIDGKIIIEGEDDSFVGMGPVLNYGRIAIRCMRNSKILFRNLKVYNKDVPYEVMDVIGKYPKNYGK